MSKQSLLTPALPWRKHFPEAWRRVVAALDLNCLEEVLLLRLLDRQWNVGWISNEVLAIDGMIRSEMTFPQNFRRYIDITKVLRAFDPIGTDGKKVRNTEVHEARERALEEYAKSSARGKHAASARWQHVSASYDGIDSNGLGGAESEG